jgi:hypothetical protein
MRKDHSSYFAEQCACHHQSEIHHKNYWNR